MKNIKVPYSGTLKVFDKLNIEEGKSILRLAQREGVFLELKSQTISEFLKDHYIFFLIGIILIPSTVMVELNLLKRIVSKIMEYTQHGIFDIFTKNWSLFKEFLFFNFFSTHLVFVIPSSLWLSRLYLLLKKPLIKKNEKTVDIFSSKSWYLTLKDSLLYEKSDQFRRYDISLIEKFLSINKISKNLDESILQKLENLIEKTIKITDLMDLNQEAIYERNLLLQKRPNEKSLVNDILYLEEKNSTLNNRLIYIASLFNSMLGKLYGNHNFEVDEYVKEVKELINDINSDLEARKLATIELKESA